MKPADKDSARLCLKCNLPLEPRKVRFFYLGYSFNTELPRCPGCGQVFLSEELVKEKVAQVERSLEDK
jgi:uncharacterized protein with PIN domain